MLHEQAWGEREREIYEVYTDDVAQGRLLGHVLCMNCAKILCTRVVLTVVKSSWLKSTF